VDDIAEKWKFLKKNLSLCHSDNHKSFMDSLELKFGLPRWEAGDYGLANFDITKANSK